MNDYPGFDKDQSGHSIEQRDTPLIEYVQYFNEAAWEGNLPHCEMIFILRGSLYISYDSFAEQKVSQEKAFLLPPGSYYRARTDTGVSIMIVRFQEIMMLFSSLSVKDIPEVKELWATMPHILDCNPPIDNYLSSLILNIQNGFQSLGYMEVKIKELFYLLYRYYRKEELSYFFSPLISSNVVFSNFILANYRKVKTVKEFAELYSCSISNFEKKFKQVFGLSPYQWMMNKKINLIRHELKVSGKSIRQISEEQGFLSLPQFSDYCKKHLGSPPGKIRKMAISEE